MFRIKTKTLLLRPVESSDAERFYRLCNDIDIARNTARIVHPYERAEADAFVARRGAGAFGDENEYVFAACFDDEIVACAGVHETSPGVCEIGYWVGADYRRRGFATEAARAVTQFAFDKLKAKTATAGHFADNPASGRVLERAGYKRTGDIIQMHSAGRGCEVDTIRMAVACDDFQLLPEIVIEETRS